MGQAAVFGRRKEPHTIIIARGEEIRHFTVKPWVAALAGSAIAVAAVGYLTATTYLVFRDDLIGATVARQARMQQDYEDRISALRTQVDRITSRQLLDQKLVESKVSELIERQDQLSEMNQRLGAAPEGGGPLPENVPAPSPKPELRAGAEPVAATAASASGGDVLAMLRGGSPSNASAADQADLLFVAMNASLRNIEADQLARIDELTDETYRTTEEIAEALQSAGLEADGDATSAVGGPYIPAAYSAPFETKIRDLDTALDKLEAVKKQARHLPLANPSNGSPVSSTFGVRKDPILGTPAMHAGIDFHAPSGSAAEATAAGKVVKAGWNGGYGQMVEIDHGNGFTTRYAHLSHIDVEEGQQVEAGQTVGEVGSTGRSTGPHLHYEVRENGSAVDPLRFLKAGKRIAAFM